MYRLLIFVLQLIFLLTILSIIFTNPFIISLDINNLKYSFSSNLLAFFIIIFLFIFYILIYLYFKSKFTLGKYILKNKYKKIEKGYYYFVEAMIAVANKDNKNASRFHKKMNNYLNEDPSLSLLLKSEVFKIERKYPELSNVYEKMIKSRKTEILGYRGLMEQNLNNEDFHHAFLYGEKLFNLNPNIEKLYDTLVYITAKTKNWNQLIKLSDKAFAKKIIDRQTLNENKSIAYYEISKINFEGNLNEALKNITKAIGLKNFFSPYIKLHLEIISKSQNLNLLKKMLKKYWANNPDPILREIITKIIKQNNLGQMNLIQQLIKNNRDTESQKLLISFAIQNKEWKLAREKIKGLIGPNPTREICLFMSDIELGENDDKQASDLWLMRSEGSLSENLWMCKITKKTQEKWSSMSESGYFNSLVFSEKKMINNINN